jgi:hypothetical protein
LKLRRPTFLLLAAALSGCYAIEPDPAELEGKPLPPGWPPPAVYDRDPLHPANRIFQRLFVLGDGAAAMSPGERDADIPFSLRQAFGEVDRAEIASLFEALARGEGGSFPSIPSVRAVFQSDLLAIGTRERGENRGLAEILGRAALRLASEVPSGADPSARVPPDPSRRVPSPVDAPGRVRRERYPRIYAAPGVGADRYPPPETGAGMLPPPLRDPSWKEEETAIAAGFRPSPADLRWTCIFRRAGFPRAAALVRLRIGIDSRKEPVLLPLGSEAWILEERGEGRSPAPRVFHFRRSRLLAGADPWDDVTERTVAIRDPRDPSRPLLAGRPEALCTGCHPGPSLEAHPPAPPPDQIGDAAEAIRGIPGTDPGTR